jgi:hypothetical protein
MRGTPIQVVRGQKDVRSNPRASRPAGPAYSLEQISQEGEAEKPKLKAVHHHVVGLTETGASPLCS